MRKIEIPVKFQKGDVIYTTKQEKVELVCHICNGEGRIKFNDKDMRCPECMGVGKFKSNKTMNVVIEEAYTISSIKISISGNDNTVTSVKYKGYCGHIALNRAEDNLFATKEEAQKRCDYLNKERKHTTIDEIVISDSFKESRPSIEKIQEKLDYYKTHNNNFDKPIAVDCNNVLVDGYITYLICKMLGISYVKVIVE